MNNREKLISAMYGNTYEEEIEEMKKYIQNLKQLSETNPELAKKIARESLQKSGILDEKGELAPPYNGQKVNEDDFTRGPKQIGYEEESDKMEEIIGYDCDGNEIEEYRILRAPFSELVEDWSEVPNLDPRFYCAVKAKDNKYYLISVYDHWSKKEIRRFEHLKDDDKIPTIVKDIEEAEEYEVAVTENDVGWYYEFDKGELDQKLNSILMNRKIDNGIEK